ncbi:MAG: mannitol dehydrogenase family protein [Proteobacteria bacterium]|nr:mannitol dehydrogenase family protein [Pseudomonadota bacterium]
MSAQPPRLSRATLARLDPGVARPLYGKDDTGVSIGVIHFGPGAFHRAHQASYFDDLLGGDPRWGISAVSLKTPDVRDALQPQDGLYGLALMGGDVRWRVIGSIRELMVAPEQPEAVFARLATEATRLVTLTVTEKGYCLAGDGTLDFDHPDVRHDLEQPDAAPLSVIGWLAEGLRRRRATGLKPFTVLSCDNLPDNGRKLAAAVTAFASARDPGLAAWIEGEARFPRSMVDAITPATDDALRARAAEALGLYDAWPIQREVFTQWVVEDVLGPDGPDLGRVGVTLTDDVSAFDRAKLRLLNGAHSSLAYLGLLAGHETVAEAMGDQALASFLRTLMIEDIKPTLTAPRGLDLDRYIDDVLGRFRNPSIRHLLGQIAWDGSQKLPVRLLGTVRDALSAGRPLDRLARPIAAWMRFIVGCARSGERPVDPMAQTLMAAGAACTGDAARDVGLFLALEPVFRHDLPASPFRQALERAYAKLVA